MHRRTIDNKLIGFTIVELVIVLATIGIIVAIASFSFGRYQAQARDSQRESDISILAESLEKYYDKNGEYPGCTAMTAAGIAATLDVDQSVIVAPQDTATASLQCSALTAGSLVDKYAYVGDGTSACNTGTSCLTWTLQYRGEEANVIRTVASRR